MSVLVLTGSARSGSFTRQLGAVLAAGTDGVLAPPLTDLPFFNQDLEATPPAAVQALREQVAAADTVVVVTPEYNGTISGLLGNAIDWLSRPVGDQPAALRDKQVVAVAASPGPVGGARALVALRTVLGNAGAALAPGGLTVGEVHTRIGEVAGESSVLGELIDLLGAIRSTDRAAA